MSQSRRSTVYSFGTETAKAELLNRCEEENGNASRHSTGSIFPFGYLSLDFYLHDERDRHRATWLFEIS
jgi:hypothetical protein